MLCACWKSNTFGEFNQLYELYLHDQFITMRKAHSWLAQRIYMCVYLCLADADQTKRTYHEERKKRRKNNRRLMERDRKTRTRRTDIQSEINMYKQNNRKFITKKKLKNIYCCCRTQWKLFSNSIVVDRLHFSFIKRKKEKQMHQGIKFYQLFASLFISLFLSINTAISHGKVKCAFDCVLLYFMRNILTILDVVLCSSVAKTAKLKSTFMVHANADGWNLIHRLIFSTA